MVYPDFFKDISSGYQIMGRKNFETILKKTLSYKNLRFIIFQESKQLKIPKPDLINSKGLNDSKKFKFKQKEDLIFYYN